MKTLAKYDRKVLEMGSKAFMSFLKVNTALRFAFVLPLPSISSLYLLLHLSLCPHLLLRILFLHSCPFFPSSSFFLIYPIPSFPGHTSFPYHYVVLAFSLSFTMFARFDDICLPLCLYRSPHPHPPFCFPSGRNRHIKRICSTLYSALTAWT
jgi:hypothetical protein